MIILLLIISALATLVALLAAFLPRNVKPMVDSFRAATLREFEIKGEKKAGGIDPEEALHLVLQWRFRMAALFLGFAALILICSTIIIVNRPPAGASSAPSEKGQETKAASLTNQPVMALEPNGK
jgi:hypothetical protein